MISSILLPESYKEIKWHYINYDLSRRASNVNSSNETFFFSLKKVRSRLYPTDYADYLALLANTQAQAESLLHSL